MKLAGQGSVYVRLLENYEADKEETVDDIITNIFEDDPEDFGNGVISQVIIDENPDYGAAVSNEDLSSASPTVVSPITVHENSELSLRDYDDLTQFIPTDESQDETPRPVLVREIVVKRSNIVESLITEFKDNDILKSTLLLVFMGDNGRLEEGRGSGVTREVLSLFWREFSVAFSIGALEKIPSIRHDHQTPEWVSVARILTFGFKEEGYFPLFLSRAFIASCIFGDESVNAECLLESFKAYISKDELETMNKCLSGDFDPNDEDVLDLLSSYNCYRQPTKENIRRILEELAHQELLQKPKYIANAWSGELQTLKSFPEFNNYQSVTLMYAEKKPTSKRVIKLLEAEPKTDADRACLGHLKRYIKSLEDNLLAGLLQFLTGSNIISVQKIQVAFNTNEGYKRGIVAHTCGPLLELSSTYQSYNELSEELTNILRISSAWDFVVV